MVDCTSFRGVWVITVYSAVLAGAFSVLPLLNFDLYVGESPLTV